jgi:hypothetical protein
MWSNYHQSGVHPLSEEETNNNHVKAKTTIAAIIDPSFPLPRLGLNKTCTTRYIQSRLVLLFLLSAAVIGAWHFELSIFQSSSSMATSPNPKAQSVLSLLGMVIIMEQLALLVAMISVLLLALWFVGTVWIDCWELVVGYWWLTMPIAGLVGVLFLLAEEGTDAIGDFDEVATWQKGAITATEQVDETLRTDPKKLRI